MSTGLPSSNTIVVSNATTKTGWHAKTTWTPKHKTRSKKRQVMALLRNKVREKINVDRETSSAKHKKKKNVYHRSGLVKCTGLHSFAMQGSLQQTCHSQCLQVCRNSGKTKCSHTNLQAASSRDKERKEGGKNRGTRQPARQRRLLYLSYWTASHLDFEKGLLVPEVPTKTSYALAQEIDSFTLV